MANYSRQNFVMPKIARSMTMKRRGTEEPKYMPIKELNFFHSRKSLNMPPNLDNFKKPGTSIEKNKPNNIFPKIGSIKKEKPSSTASNDLFDDDISSQISNKFRIKRNSINEINKEEFINFHKVTTINNSNKNQKNSLKLINDINIEKENENEEEKVKKPTNKNKIDINKYKDICVNILSNNNDLNKIFVEIYNNKINTQKWIENNLFGREVFKIRLEAYIKNKTDVISYIKSEIEKILNNEYCDYLFSKSFKQIESQYDEHMKYTENL